MTPGRSWQGITLLAWASCVGCAQEQASGEPGGGATPPRAAVSVSTPAPAEPPSEAPPEPAGPPKRLFAKKFVVPVRVGPTKESFRKGYLRGGAVFTAKTSEPVGYDSCRLGWYEIAETGGFVCSTVDVVAFDGEKLPERRPLQPDLGAMLPYPYGYSRRTGTPVFRRLPSDEEWADFLGLVAKRSEPVAATDAPAEASETGEGAGTHPEGQNDQPSAEAEVRGKRDDGRSAEDGADPAKHEQVAGGDTAAPGNAVGSGEGQEVPDGGVTTLASLMGDEDSVLLRRMERGFYVSLDTEMQKGARRYWRTQANGFIPYDRLSPVRGSDFHGVHLEAEDAPRLPIGYLLSSRNNAYRLNDRGKLRKDGKPGYHHLFKIAGETEIGGRSYWIADDGRHYRQNDARRIEARERPRGVVEDEKWIDVNLDTQSLVAYLGDRPVFATLISSGSVTKDEDPLKDFQTPTGEFRIKSKRLTATMDGDHALDGPYSIEDVPYVMYFELAYAIHSAFWHNTFGRPRSHGCVNMAPLDAQWLFNWSSPSLPIGWHVVYPTDDDPGTRLFIHGETPKRDF